MKKSSVKERLNALCEAIKTNPRSRDAYSRLIDYAAPETLQDEKAIWLRDAILGSPNPAVIHVILGMQEIKGGDFVQGQKHWRIADQQFDLAQFIVNNMIELALAEKPEAFGNLLDMITVAMELFPDQAALFQTRGMYYLDNQQYDKAIEDLEYAVEKMPRLISARTHLKEAYEGNNDQENADRVQNEIDMLVAELDDAQKRIIEQFLKDVAEKADEDAANATE